MIHVVMPFSRGGYIDLIESLYRPFRVILHPIMDMRDRADFKWSDLDWIEPMYVDIGNNKHPMNLKINTFIKKRDIIPDDYYWIMADDDSFDVNLIPTIYHHKNPIIFVSMKRGDNIPESATNHNAHPVSTLVAHPDFVMIDGIGMQQMFIKGFIFKSIVWPENVTYGDGLIAMALKERFEIKYLPDEFVLFNYFEPGRYNGQNFKLKGEYEHQTTDI